MNEQRLQKMISILNGSNKRIEYAYWQGDEDPELANELALETAYELAEFFPTQEELLVLQNNCGPDYTLISYFMQEAQELLVHNLQCN